MKIFIMCNGAQIDNAIRRQCRACKEMLRSDNDSTEQRSVNRKLNQDG